MLSAIAIGALTILNLTAAAGDSKEQPSSAMPAPIQVSTSGTVFTSSDWIDAHFEKGGFEAVPMWSTLGNYHGQSKQGNFTGKIEIGPFTLGKKLRLFMGGSLSSPAVHRVIQDTQSLETLEIQSKLRIDGINFFQWSIPKKWQGRTVLLVGTDEDPKQDAWIGFSLPQDRVPKIVRYTHTLALFRVLLNLIAPLFLFLIVGIAGYGLLVRVWPAARNYMPILILTLPLAVGYLEFYVALKSLFFAYLIGMCCITAAVSFLLMGGVRRSDFPKADIQFFTPVFLLVILGVIMLTSILYLGWSTRNPLVLAQERLLSERLPLDNYLPLLTLDRVYHQESLKPFIIEWRSTDRPPLQTAACLLVRPFFIDQIEGYHIFSCWLQASILLGVGFLLQSLGISRRKALIICGLILFSGTYVINTLFVWPKLYAINFPLFMSGMLLRKREFQSGFGFWLIAGSISAFALLIHPGSLFALVAILAVYTVKHRRVSWQQVLAAIVVFLLWMAPWAYYQKHYDPPGNFMQKRFFANYPYFNDVTFQEALKIGYGSLTPASWAEGRWENIKTVIGDFHQAYRAFFSQLLSESLRLRMYVFNFIGVSLIPVILGYPLGFFARKTRPADLKQNIRFLHIVIALGMTAWILLILPAGRTIITHGSFYFPVLLMILSGLLVQHNKRLLHWLFGIQFFYFLLVWGIPAMRSADKHGVLLDLDFIDPGSVILFFVSLFLIFLVLFRCKPLPATDPDETGA